MTRWSPEQLAKFRATMKKRAAKKLKKQNWRNGKVPAVPQPEQPSFAEELSALVGRAVINYLLDQR